MYQYSLPFFVNLFTTAIVNSEPSEDLEERLQFLNDEFLVSLYRNICRSLAEKDKLIFSFLLTTKLLQMSGELELVDFMFLLTGGVQIGENEEPSPAEWLTEKSWGEILRAGKLGCFKDFLIPFFKENIKVFGDFYASASPDSFEYPEHFNEKLNSFQKMILLRCLRPDKVVPAI